MSELPELPPNPVMSLPDFSAIAEEWHEATVRYIGKDRSMDAASTKKFRQRMRDLGDLRVTWTDGAIATCLHSSGEYFTQVPVRSLKKVT